jgi:hypothetical protein
VPRKPQPRDPNLDHPAVKLYIDICHSTPNHVQRQAIVDKVTKLDLYGEILRQFMTEGRPPHRVDWTLERYHNALPSAVGRGSSPTVKEGFEVSPDEDAWMRRRVGAR